VAAVWFGVPEAVLAARTPPGDRPGIAWVVALALSVLGLGVAAGALVRAREPWVQALAVAAALTLGFDAAITAVFATSSTCGVENTNSCDTVAAVGAVAVAVPAFCAFLLGVSTGRFASRVRGH
jgi:hypothetical protein